MYIGFKDILAKNLIESRDFDKLLNQDMIFIRSNAWNLDYIDILWTLFMRSIRNMSIIKNRIG